MSRALPKRTTQRGRRVVRLGLVLAAAAAALWQVGLTAAGPPLAAARETSGVRFDGKSYTNRLVSSHDPYLLMHAHNPVDWYPWGPEAFAKARRENKPIFLSVGYSTCYWCHVAEREIYSNPDIARLMNRWFVNIKVDREERPDVDRVYMVATQLMTGGGGWPNNVFLTPDLKPFYAGSYFPPRDEGGRPGFPAVLATLHKAWVGDRAKVEEVAARVYRGLQKAEQGAGRTGSAPPLAPAQWLQHAAKQAAHEFDSFEGGFSGGGATKFPREPLLSMLLAEYSRSHDLQALRMVTDTLQAMAEGGIMDQLAGGFHRYSTDPDWSIPHFEKMLYDNGQLLGLYARAYALTKRPLFKQVALRTARYLRAEMRASGGGFYSAQDSQIDGVEGVSYVWTRAQIEAVLGEADAKRFFELYALTPMPSAYAGQKQSPGSVLRLDAERAQALADKDQLAAAIEALAPQREKLLAARNRRPQPARDETIVTADNALAILDFVQAGQALGDPTLTQTAVETADWEWTRAFDPPSGLLRHQFFRGHAGGAGFLDDYALLGRAFLDLHSATGDAVWRSRAQRLADAILARFARPDGSLATTTDSADLLVAPPSEGDSVRPSGQSAAVALLLALSAEGGEPRYARAARRALTSLGARIDAEPEGWSALLAALGRPSLVAALDRATENGARAASGPPDSADHVHARARWTSPNLGSLVVEVEIDAGYHINANPASDPDLIPTTLTLNGYPDLRIDYPAGHDFKAPFAPQAIAVYTGRVALRARLVRPPAKIPAAAKLRVQACNDRYCLAPATIEVPLEVEGRR